MSLIGVKLHTQKKKGFKVQALMYLVLKKTSVRLIYSLFPKK